MQMPVLFCVFAFLRVAFACTTEVLLKYLRACLSFRDIFISFQHEKIHKGTSISFDADHWPLAIYDYIWLYLTIYGPYMTMYDHAWPYMTMYGYIWRMKFLICLSVTDVTIQRVCPLLPLCWESDIEFIILFWQNMCD